MKDMTTKTKLPELTQQPIWHIDGTPNDDYPLRILRVYRENCNSYWVVEGIPDNEKLIYDMMNEYQKQRAEILDKAIEKLRK